MTDTVRQFLLDYKTGNSVMQAGYGGSCSYLLPALGKQSRRLSEFAAAWST